MLLSAGLLSYLLKLDATPGKLNLFTVVFKPPLFLWWTGEVDLVSDESFLGDFEGCFVIVELKGDLFWPIGVKSVHLILIGEFERSVAPEMTLLLSSTALNICSTGFLGFLWFKWFYEGWPCTDLFWRGSSLS